MALTRCQIVCLTGHMVGFIILLFAYASPFWTVTHALVENSTWFVVSFGPVLYLSHELDLDGNYSTEIKLLEWDDFDGYLPEWVNIVRVVAASALLFQLITILMNTIACAKFRARHFFIQAITSFISVASSIAAIAIFDFKIQDEKFDGECLSIYWSFYLYILGAVVIFICAILSLCAREMAEDSETRPLLVASTEYFVGQTERETQEGSFRQVYLLDPRAMQ